MASIPGKNNFVTRGAVILAIASLFFATSTFAAGLSCVQRAIDWNAGNSKHYVSFTLVALHESQVASYASGRLSNSSCTRAPYASGTVSCLATSGWVNALLSDRSFTTPSVTQPFNANTPLLIAVDSVPADTLARVHLHQANATYDFDPRCQGNLLIGDDQWGNHWTFAFGLGSDQIN